MAKDLKTEVAMLIEDKIEQNNRTLLDSMKSLLDSSVQQLKRSSTENTENQLKEIKKLKYSEPQKFKKKANEDQYKFNAKLADSMVEVSETLEAKEINKAQETLQKGKQMLSERQKHILLADKSEFGWGTVHEYKKHELAEKSESRAKAQRKKTQSNFMLKRYSNSSRKEEFMPRQYNSSGQIPNLRASVAYPPSSHKSNFKPGSCYGLSLKQGTGNRGLGNGEWGIGDGEWGTGESRNGEWGMGNGERGMGNGGIGQSQFRAISI